MSERVERIRQLWGAANPDEHRAPQLIRDVQTLLTALAQAERERMTPEAAEEMLRLRDERDAARAEVERWKKRVTMLETEEKWEALKQAEADLARTRAALEAAANRLDIAANVIRSGAEFARWADEARAALEGR